MTVSPRGSLLGIQVTRAAALLPGTTTASIFTVSSGRVFCYGLFGVVVTATPGTANTLQIKNTPAPGTALNLSTAVSVATLEAGSHASLTDAAGGALIVGNAGTAPRVIQPFILNPGAIQLITTGTAATGTWQWDLFYWRIDKGAAVVAA